MTAQHAIGGARCAARCAKTAGGADGAAAPSLLVLLAASLRNLLMDLPSSATLAPPTATAATGATPSAAADEARAAEQRMLMEREVRDTAEMQPRCSRDAAEMQPRCGRGAAEMQPR